jgi:hypothetical protein
MKRSIIFDAKCHGVGFLDLEEVGCKEKCLPESEFWKFELDFACF